MVSNKKSNLSILVPALNEEADLEDTFMCICDAAQIDQSIQIILVNDGSSDSTGEIVDRLSDYRTESINVSSVHNEIPIGLGAVYALRSSLPNTNTSCGCQQIMGFQLTH